MNARSISTFLRFGIVGAVGLLPNPLRCQSTPPAPSTTSQPIAFVENRGQWNSPARFVARNGPLVAHFADADWTLDMLPDRSRLSTIAGTAVLEADAPKRSIGCVVRLRFAGDAQNTRPVGEHKLPGIHNFLGAKQTAGVGSWSSIVYRGVYPGVDVRVRSERGVIEYDLILEAGASLEQVVLHCAGIRGIALEPDGALVLETALGPIRQAAPRTWEVDTDGTKRLVECRYRRIDETHFGFVAPSRDPSVPMVVDPGLDWSTVLGGVGFDPTQAMGTQSNGNVIVGGFTSSVGYPTTTGSYQTTLRGMIDCYVSALSADGSTLRWSTLIGGTQTDLLSSLEIDPIHDDVLFAGTSESTDFPVTMGAIQPTKSGGYDAIIGRLSADGSTLRYATFYGGNGDETLLDLAMDAAGHVLAVGLTTSTNLLLSANAYQTLNRLGPTDAVVLRTTVPRSGSGALLAATYLGGSGREGQEFRNRGTADTFDLHVAVDSTSQVIVAGTTESQDFPTSAGAFDETHNGNKDFFVTRLDAGLTTLVASTFIGAPGVERRGAVELDADGAPIVVGYTSSAGFPTTVGAYHERFAGREDGVLFKLDRSLTQLEYSTFIGGPQFETLNGLDVDASGTITAFGEINGPFGATPGAYDTSFNGGSDAFVVRLRTESRGSDDLLYATYIGGGGTGYDVGWRGIVQGNDVILSGWTIDASFPTTTGAFDTTHNGGEDAFVCRIEMLPTGTETYGRAFPGCSGDPVIGVTEQPSRTERNFALTCSNAPRNAPGVLLIGFAPSQVPLPVVGIELFLLPVFTPGVGSDGLGYCASRLDIPAFTPSGATAYAQFVWASRCGAQGFASSEALRLTVQ